MIKEIVVERTLLIGGAKVSEGDEVYVKYRTHGDTVNKCIYAVCAEITDTYAAFITNKKIFVKLSPAEILAIEDKPSLTEVECILAHVGEIVEYESE